MKKGNIKDLRSLQGAKQKRRDRPPDGPKNKNEIAFGKRALCAKRTGVLDGPKNISNKKAENVRSLLFDLCQQGKSVFVDFKGLGLT